MDKFLQEEQERFDREWPSARSYTGGIFNEWLSAHDSRLIAKIREIFEDHIDRSLALHPTSDFEHGYADALKDIKHLLSLLPDNTKK